MLQLALQGMLRGCLWRALLPAAVLHWGVKQVGKGNDWVRPSESLLPPGSELIKDSIAAETAFNNCTGGWALLRGGWAGYCRRRGCCGGVVIGFGGRLLLLGTAASRPPGTVSTMHRYCCSSPHASPS